MGRRFRSRRSGFQETLLCHSISGVGPLPFAKGVLCLMEDSVALSRNLGATVKRVSRGSASPPPMERRMNAHARCRCSLGDQTTSRLLFK